MTRKRILIVTDSHGAALLTALDQNPPVDFDIHVVIGIGPIARRIAFENGYVFFREKPEAWPPAFGHPVEFFDKWYDEATARLKKFAPDGRLAVDTYDHLVFYGGRISNIKWYNFPVQAGYSLELKHEVFRDVYSDRTIAVWMDALENLGPSSCQLHYVPDPLVNEAGIDHEGESYTDLGHIKAMPNNACIEEAIPFFKELFLKKHAVNFIPLPDELLNAKKNATRREFSPIRPNDFEHISPQGAQLILDHVLTEIG